MDLEARLAELDWRDLPALAADLPALLAELTDGPTWIAGRLEAVLEDPELAALSERFEVLDKIVLYDCPDQDVRVRLHIFHPDYFDWPHNHRYRFGTVLLAGSYEHFVYGDYPDLTEDGTDVLAEPAFIGSQTKGTGYVLSHTVVHSLVGTPDTVSLIVRGPRFGDRAMIFDPESRQGTWYYGAKDQSDDEIESRRLSRADIVGLRTYLARLGVV